MLYSTVKKDLPIIAKELIGMINNDANYSYTESHEGKISFDIDKENRKLNLKINDIEFNIGPRYFGERFYIDFDKYENAFTKQPEMIMLLSKLFTRLACENDEEFDKVFKYNNEEYDRNIIRLQVMKLAKGFNDLHGWFADPEYLEEEIREYEEAEYYARQRRADEESFWEEMAAVGVTPEDVYD